jgi:hypothetical protein
MSREAMKLALEALEWNLPLIEDFGDKEQLHRQHKAITSLYQAFAEAEKQEPVSWFSTSPDGKLSNLFVGTSKEVNWTPIYTEPPKQWVWLTEREVELIDEMIETQLLHAERCDHMANSTMAQKQKAWDLERVELLRKLKEKNHG